MFKLFHSKKVLISIILFAICFCLFAQNNNPTISYKGSGNYILRERTDLRRYDNGKYFGLVSQEVSSFIIPVSFNNYFVYEGEFYILQDTRHNYRTVASGLNEAIPSKFKIDKSGQLTMIEDHGFPTFRSFPSFSNKNLSIGDVWEAKAERAVDPLNKGIVTKMPIYVQYKYLKDDFFHDEPIFVISAQWATRYGMGTGNYYIDWGGDKELQRANGSHKATIYVSKITGNALLIQDLVDETFLYADGNQYQFKGTISQFTEYPPAIDRSKIITALKRIASISEENEQNLMKVITAEETNESYTSKVDKYLEEGGNKPLVTVDNTPAGLRLTIPDLQFQANSAELLPEETTRLDKIAQVLQEIPECKFLIEGHTASTGRPQGELELSVERAISIKNALIKRGLSENRFICKGSGGTKPIADNETVEGKAKNRRVEITILE